NRTGEVSKQPSGPSEPSEDPTQVPDIQEFQFRTVERTRPSDTVRTIRPGPGEALTGAPWPRRRPGGRASPMTASRRPWPSRSGPGSRRPAARPRRPSPPRTPGLSPPGVGRHAPDPGRGARDVRHYEPYGE